MQGKEVPNPVSAIRLFALLDGMKWAHLPVAGGLYDQDPGLLEQFRYIFGRRAEWEEQQRKKDAANARNQRGQRMMGHPSRVR